MADASVNVKIGAEDGASAIIAGVAQSLVGLNEGALRAATGLGSLNAAMIAETAGLGALIGGFADAAKSAADFQTQLSRAQANTTLTTEQTQAMGEAIVKMSANSGASLQDLGAGYVHIANIMGDATQATNILNIAQESAVSTGGNVADYAQTLARVMHEYESAAANASTTTQKLALDQSDAAKTMDQLHTAAAAGDLTLEQFTSNSGNAIATAANYGVALDQVTAAYITLTKHGMDAADANTQISDQMLRLTTPTAKVTAELEALGKASGVDLVADFSATGLATKGLTGIYDDLHTAETNVGMSAEEMTKENMLLGDALRGGRGLVIDVGTGYQDYKTILGQVDDASAAAAKRQDDYNRAINTTGGQLAILKANAAAAAVTVGGPLNDAADAVLHTFTQSASSVPQLGDALSGLGGRVTALVETFTGSGGLNSSLDGTSNSANGVGTAFEHLNSFLTESPSKEQAAIDSNKGLTDSFNALGTAIQGAGSWLSQFNATGERNVPGAAGLDKFLGSAAQAVAGAVGGAFSGLGTDLSGVGTAADQAQMSQRDAAMRQVLHDKLHPLTPPDMSGPTTLPPITVGTTSSAESMQAEKGAVQNVKDIIASTKAAINENDVATKQLNASIQDTTEKYQDQIDPIQRQLDLENQSYALQSAKLKSAADGITNSYQQQLDPLQQQLALLDAQHTKQADDLTAAADGVKTKYEGQIQPLQAQLDTINLQYDAQRGKLQVSVEQVTAEYAKQMEPLQNQLDKLNEQHQLIAGPLKDSIDQIKLGYEQQLEPLQHQLDLLNQQYTVSQHNLEGQIKGVQDSFVAPLDAAQSKLDDFNGHYTDQTMQLNARIQDITRSYKDQLDPLQEQLTNMQQANTYAKEQLDDQNKIATAQLQQAMLAAEGDPAKRAEIAAQLEINKAQEDKLKLQQQEITLQQQVAGMGAGGTGNPLLDAKRQDAQLQLQDTQLQLQLAGMVDTTQQSQIIREQQQLAGQQAITKAVQDQKDAQTQLSEIPLEQQIKSVQDAQKDALQPIQDQLSALKEEHDLEAGPLQAAIKALQGEEKARLGPLQEQLATLTSQHDLATFKLQGSIDDLKNKEYDRLTPLQDQLNMLDVQYNTMVGPLNNALLVLKDKEKDRLQPIQDQLAALQLQYNITSTPLQQNIKQLQFDEQQRLQPIQLQQQSLDAQYRLASGPLKEAITTLQNEEKGRLAPIQEQQKSLQAQHDLMDAQLKGDIDTIKTKEQDALKPMQDQVQALKDQNVQLDLAVSKWDQIAADQGKAADAAQRQAEAMKQFHAPGKGPLDAPGKGAAMGAAPTVGLTAQGDGHDVQRGIQAFAAAQGFLGVNSGTYYRNGDTWCEQFAEDITGYGNMGGSAAQAWTNWGAKELPGQLYGGPSLVYFAGPTAAGHVGISDGSEMVSVLDPKWGITQESPMQFLADNPGARLLGSVPLYAQGTDAHPGGWAVVGDRGPELLNLPMGSQVIPNHQLGGVGGGIDYDRLAHAVVAALRAEPPVIQLDGQRVSQSVRTNFLQLQKGLTTLGFK